MSHIVLVRHAQASFSADPERAFKDYDRLSDLGRRQAEALGEELAKAEVTFDRVYAGPSVRHRETAGLVGAAYARLGSAFPEILPAEDLAEHQGARVVRRALEGEQFVEERTRLAAAANGGDPTSPELRREYLTIFRQVTRQWARRELVTDSAEESWQAFRARIEAGMRRILEDAGKGATVGVFTSGGPIGSTVAWALGLDDERALEMAWIVENATITELLSTDGRMSLKSFNVQPRIASTEFITYV